MLCVRQGHIREGKEIRAEISFFRPESFRSENFVFRPAGENFVSPMLPFRLAQSSLSQETAVPEPTVPGTEILTEETTGTGLDAPWRVILYNDEVHTFEEVIVQLVKATGCTPRRANAYVREVHTTGKAAVYEGEFEECFEVQGVLREIDLVTEIEG